MKTFPPTLNHNAGLSPIGLTKRYRLYLFGFIAAFWLMSFDHAILAAEGSVELAQLAPGNIKEFRIGGKEADSIYGDYILRNSKIACAIAAPLASRNANMTVRGVGGCLIDYCGRDQNNDQLSCYYPLGAGWAFNSGAAPEIKIDGEKIEMADSSLSGELIQITFSSVKKSNGTQAKVTYELAQDAEAIKVTSTITNSSEQPVSITTRDAFRADRTFRFGTTQDAHTFWANDEWFKQSYGLVNREGTLKRQQGGGVSVEIHSEGTATKEVAPNETTVASRWLVTGSSQLELLGKTAMLLEQPVHDVNLKVQDVNGVVGNARVELKLGDVSYGVARSGKTGELLFSVPAGTYQALVTGPGRPEKTIPLEVAGPISAEVELDPPGFIRVIVTDEQGEPIPCKIGFYGMGETEDPYFGPDSKAAAVQNLVYTSNGKMRRAIHPGTFELVISHGPEFNAVVEAVEVKPNEVSLVRATLEHVVETPGWVSTEYHSHSSPSGDNTSSQFGRVLNLLAEQIEFAPCTEHNRISTYSGHLKRLGLTDAMATCSGMELTGSPLPVNHQNAFPLKRKYLRQDGGGPTTASDPVVQIKRLAAWDEESEKLIQTNHPEVLQVYDDKDRDGIADGGFREMLNVMDVMEVHPLESILERPTEYALAGSRGNTIFQWLQLLNQGYRIPGVVNTDAHYNFHGSGWLRNYVASSTDEPAQIETMEMVKATKQGNVIMTTGPYMEVSMSASNDPNLSVTAGDDLASPSGKVQLKIEVACSNWLDINRVQILFNGREQEKLNFTRRTHANLFSNDVIKFSQTLDLTIDTDTHVIVIAAGEGLNLGRVMGPTAGKKMPIAVSNPIYIDVDGDGFQFNNDTLDAPLPRPKESE